MMHPCKTTRPTTYRTYAGCFLYLLLFALPFTAAAQTGCWKTVACAADHMLAIKNDGTLWSWGGGNYGQTGQGSTTAYFAPTQVGTLNSWKTIAVGDLRSFGILEDGSLYGWGLNWSGELGLGDTSVHTAPVLIPGGPWKAVACNTFVTVGIKADGTLWAWGADDYGLLGNGPGYNSSMVQTQIGTGTDWEKLAAGSYHMLAVKENGTLWGWGYNGGGQLANGTPGSAQAPVQSGTATNWRDIAAGNDFSIATKSNGTLWFFGAYLAADGNATVPVQVGTATDWTSIAAGFANAIAVRGNGTMWAWGTNFAGELGNGTTNNASAPTQAGTGTHWKQAAIDTGHGVAIQTDGSLYTWGQNNNGILGNGTNTDSTTPGPVACPTSLGTGEYTSNPAITLYPNPASNQLTIRNNGTEILKYEVRNVLGSTVLQATGNTIDVSGLPDGIYLLTAHSDSKIYTEKFVVKR